MEKPKVDINHKKWLNLGELISYIGFGSHDTFRQWREGVKTRAGKTIYLKYYKAGKNIIFKRTDVDVFLENFLVD